MKVETQGSVGAKNVLTAEDIAAADAVVIAADTKVDLSRFVGKRIYQTGHQGGAQARRRGHRQGARPRTTRLSAAAAGATGGGEGPTARARRAGGQRRMARRR